MRTKNCLALTVLLAVLPSCASYQVPAVSACTSLSLSRADVAGLAPTKGADWAAGIFPLWLFAPAGPRAESYAIGQATQVACIQMVLTSSSNRGQRRPTTTSCCSTTRWSE